MRKRIKLPRRSWIGIACALIAICGIGVYLIYQHGQQQSQCALQGVRHTIPSKPSESTKPTLPSASPTQTYITKGKIPITGLQVGATFYGALAEPKDGHYILSNLIQGGVRNGGIFDGYDDNGQGSCGGKYENLSDLATWGENDNGTVYGQTNDKPANNGSILGSIPCGTKLEISYHGHTIIAEKSDGSNGGCAAPATRCSDNGHERAIDLWWQTAKALCFTNQPDVMTIHVVPESTPTTVIPNYIKSDSQSTAVCE